MTRIPIKVAILYICTKVPYQSDKFEWISNQQKITIITHLYDGLVLYIAMLST